MAANSEAFFIDFRIMARIYIYIYKRPNNSVFFFQEIA